MSERWGVIGIPVTEEGRMLVLPGLAENEGKKERVVGYQEDVQPVSGHEFLGGAVDKTDVIDGQNTLQLALLREIAEESGMILSPDQLEATTERYEVVQLRDGRMQHFLVAAYFLRLSQDQALWLQQLGAKEFDKTTQLRPRDQVISAQFVESLVIPLLLGDQMYA